MEITITLRGTLIKYFEGTRDRKIDVPESCTAGDALKLAGIDWETIANFGFVAINGNRVMIFHPLQEGDEVKAYSKISGG
jgi:hypothetical protein